MSRRRGTALVGAVCLVLAGSLLWQSKLFGDPGGPEAKGAEPRDILVKFRSREDALGAESAQKPAGRLRPELASLLDRHRIGRGRRVFPRTPFRGLDRVVRLPLEAADGARNPLAEALAALRSRPEVEYAEPNVVLQAFGAPNDPYYSSSGSWGQTFGDLWGLSLIQASPAWDRSQGAGVVVAVIDTGIDLAHVDLAPNVWLNASEGGLDGLGRDRRSNGVDDDGNGFVDDWRGWNFVGTGPGSNDPTDNHGHGTHVAGTVGAVGDNGIGVVGVAPQSRVMAVKVLDANGFGSVADISEGIVYAANAGARVMNASLGARGATPQVLVDAIAYAHDVKGAVFVAAAGNDNGDVGTPVNGIYPANILDAVAVSAFDHLDQKASFSSYGARIDVAAPGGGDADSTGTIYAAHRSILSLRSQVGNPSMLDPGLFVGANYLRQAGTSMAAPHVAGVAALVLSLHPEFSPEQVRQAIRKGAVDTGAVGFDHQSGYGRLDADRASVETDVLAARLTSYVAPFAAGTSVEIRGTTEGTTLTGWTLEYGRGSFPTSWTLIASGAAAVNKAPLAQWDTAEVPDGQNVLRLTANNAAGRVYEDRLPVFVDSVVIGSVGRGLNRVDLFGTVAPAGFGGYSITVTGRRRGSLANPNITLPNGGTQPVRDALLGSWDTNGVAADHYQVCLVSTNGAFTTECVTVFVDPDLRAGWPQDLALVSLFPGFGAALTDHLTAADIDGDGGKELIVAYGPAVHVFRHDGTPLPGWPQFPDLGGMVFQTGPAVGDLTGDGVPEIAVAHNSSTVYIWDAQGRLLPGWPRPVYGSATASLVIDDINGDGRNELIAAGSTTNSTWIGVMDVSGNSLPGWPRNPGWGYSQSLAVGDVDGDGAREVVVQEYAIPNRILVYRADGTLQPGWPREGNPAGSDKSYSYPALGDLDGDGAAEIVVGSVSGRVYAFRGDGSQLAGWPQQALTTAHSAAIGDIDGDGRPEVVVGTRHHTDLRDYLYAWRADGTLLPGWPVKSGLAQPVAQFGYGVPILADMDGDGRADVVASSDAGLNQLDAFRFDGTAVAGFPRLSLDRNNWGTVGPVAADLDGDGRRELAWLNRLSLVVWNLGAGTTTPAPWPMFRGDAGHRGRLHDSLPTVALTGPAEGTVFPAGASILLTATASDEDGQVTAVEFFQGASKLGEDTAAPYELLWSNVGPGAYSLTARARDDAGQVVTSPPVSVIVNAPPTVSLTAPAPGAQFTAPAAIRLAAAAADVDGSIAQVEFFQGTSRVGVVTANPYEMTLSNMTPGVYTFSALATDDRGATVASASSSVTVVGLLRPTADAYVAGGGADAGRNFGRAAGLLVKHGSHAKDIRWSYIKFDLSTVPSVQSAKLRLFGRLSAASGTTVRTAVYPVASAAWVETAITWNNKPASGTTALASITLANSTSGAWYEWDVTQYVRSEKAAGRDLVSLALKNLAASSPYVQFDSRDSTGQLPELIVTP